MSRRENVQTGKKSRRQRRSAGDSGKRGVIYTALVPDEAQGVLELPAFWVMEVIKRAGVDSPGIEVIVDDKACGIAGMLTVNGGRPGAPLPSPNYPNGVKIVTPAGKKHLEAAAYRVRSAFWPHEKLADRRVTYRDQDGKERKGFSTALNFKTMKVEDLVDLVDRFGGQLNVTRLTTNFDDVKMHGVADRFVERAYL